MPEVICNTSPLQYLHQLGLLHILPALNDSIIVPLAVVTELSQGRQLGYDLPDIETISWITIHTLTNSSLLPHITDDLGSGETEVLALALEISDTVVVLDDALGRLAAKKLSIHFTGTLGLLLDAKKISLLDTIAPRLDQLQALGFRLSPQTHRLILNLANE